MLRSERLHNNHRGLWTRWNHTDLRARKVARKLWTDESDCQASTKANGHLLRGCYRVDVAFMPKCLLLPNDVGFGEGDTTATAPRMYWRCRRSADKNSLKL